MIISVPEPGCLNVLSPAKINLFLHVTGKRPDGYHEIVSLMCGVTLYDTLTFTFDSQNISVSCKHPEVPENDANLAFRAADRFLRAIDATRGVRITIDKKIPVAAGLGGGSSNAAAVLLGLNRYFHFPFSDTQLMSMGRSLGADVPFFIFRKPAVATGIGEHLEPYDALPPLTTLLVNPGFSVSTADAYKNINLGLTKCKKKFSIFSFKNKDFEIERHLCNDLERVTAAGHPEIVAAKSALLEAKAVGSLMSGSGPTVFGLFFDRETACEAKRLLARQYRWQLFLADLIVT